MREDVVAKGAYARPQTENAVEILNWVIAREGKRRYLLLKLKNEREQTLTGLRLKIECLNARGRTISVKDLYYGEEHPCGEFVLNRKIYVSPDCADVTVKAVYAQYGDFRFTRQASGGAVDFAPEPERDSDTAVKGAMKVGRGKYKTPLVIALFSFVLALTAFLFTYLHLVGFVENAHGEFLYNGVVYLYTDLDEALVTGYGGNRANVVIPEYVNGRKVTGIVRNAFAGKNIKSVTVEGDAEIFSGAFANCTELVRADIEDVTELGREAFVGCTALKSVTAKNLRMLGAYAFYKCSSLESVEISNPMSALYINAGAFNDCDALQRVVIDQFAYYPSEPIFGNCRNIEELTLANFDAWDGWRVKTLSSLFAANASDASVVTAVAGAKVIRIGELDRIADGFCRDMRALSGFYVSELTDRVIGDSAFENCGELKDFYIPVKAVRVGNAAFRNTAVESFDSGEVMFVGDDAFGNTPLTYFNGRSLIRIGDRAFADNARLRTFSLDGNAGLNSIGEYAFIGCESLESFSLPAGITELRDGTFENCLSLKNVILSGDSQLRSIGAYAFLGCGSLNAFRLTARVQTIGGNAFLNCVNLETVINESPLEIEAGSENYGYIALYAQNVTVVRNGDEE